MNLLKYLNEIIQLKYDVVWVTLFGDWCMFVFLVSFCVYVCMFRQRWRRFWSKGSVCGQRPRTRTYCWSRQAIHKIILPTPIILMHYSSIFGHYLCVPLYGTISHYDIILGLDRTYHQRHIPCTLPWHSTLSTWVRSLEPSLVLMPCLESSHRLR